MGNSQIRDFFSNKDNLGSQSLFLKNFLHSELLNTSSFLSEKWVSLNIDKTKDHENFFDWTNVHQQQQTNEVVEENKRVKRFKENLLIGNLPEQNSKDFLNPQMFDENQSAFSPQNVKQFKDSQNTKFLVLNQAFSLMEKERKNEFSILQSIKTKFNESDVPKAAEVGIRSGIMLIITLLKEASKQNPALRDSTLDFLIELFAEVKPLSLWGNNKIDIILDKALHTVAEFLEELINSNETNKDSKSKAMKVLFSLGLLRGSLPNLLSVVNLLRNHDLQMELGNEIDLFRKAKPNMNFDFESVDSLKGNCKVFFRSSLGKDDKAPEKAPLVSIACDGKYLYIFSEIEGLFKIGSGFKYTMFGKVYKHNQEFHNKEKGTLVFIYTDICGGKLYFRSPKVTQQPLIEIDTETLEEKQTKITYDANVPNCLFSEMTNPEIEFPVIGSEHKEQIDEQNQLDQQQQIEGNEEEKKLEAKKIEETKTHTTQQTTAQKDALQKREIRLMRPAARSPMFTEGRFLYIISQWTVEQRTGQASESDDEDEQDKADTNFKQAKFGVDIYDPLNDFEHIRSVELSDPNNLSSGEKDKDKDKANIKKTTKPPITAKVLEMASFTTNGSQLLVGIPPGAEESSEIKYKYFNLKDGKLEECNIIKDKPNYYFNVCYDYENNCIWGLNDNKKTFENLSCYVNKTIPEKMMFNEDMEQYQPYENERIVEFALEELGFSEEDKNMEKIEKIKEDWHMLLSLGFTKEDRAIQEEMVVKKEFGESQSKVMQLFILANIARLADSYANLKHFRICKKSESPQIDSFRKPYCVHLLPKVFKYLEEFVDFYSQSFLKSEDNIYNNCSLLCTLRIIKYNLAYIEAFQEQLEKLNIRMPSKTFAVKLSKLITTIFNSTQAENRDFEEMRKALYNEAISILRYNLTIIYPTMPEIINLLMQNLQDMNKKLNKDIILAILGYLKEENHAIELVKQCTDLKNPKREQLSTEVLNLINLINSSEVNQFKKYLSTIQNPENFPVFESDELISQLSQFLIELQKEILYQLGQRVSEKSLEQTPIVILNTQMTESITKYAIQMNSLLENSIKDMSGILKEIITEKHQKEEEEKKSSPKKVVIIGGQEAKSKKDKKEKTLEQKIYDANTDLWGNLTTIFIDKIHFSLILSFQINCLSLVASDFLIAAKILKHVSAYLYSLNRMYLTRKKIQNVDQEKVSTVFKEKFEVFECEHPVPTKVSKKEKIQISGAKSLRVVFDPQCDLRRNCDYLQFWYDEQCQKDKITERLDKSGTDSRFPKEDLIIKGDTFYYHFNSDNCRNSQWGYKFTVYANVQDATESDWVHNLHRTTAWLSSKCAAQLINGQALQQALLQDEEQRYNALLNSKLFSGGIEKCHFSGGKEAIWMHLTDIINEFEAGHLQEYLSSEMNEMEKEEWDTLNEVLNGEKNEGISGFLKYLQTEFSKGCLWANLGGEVASKLVRAAFTVILKHGGLTEDFIKLAEAYSQGKISEIDEKIVKNFVKKWGTASKMRTWLVEKKKEIDDLAEKNRHQAAQARQTRAKKKDNVKKQEEPSKIRPKRRVRGRGGHEVLEERKVQEEEEEQIIEEPAVNLEVQSTEQIIDRMVDSIQKKAQFLIQLIPSQYWSKDIFERPKEKQFLLRQTSHVEELENKEEEWKRRLQQWKSVRQSKGVYKSLEEESAEIHSSLTTSVLSCLQSPVSIKRLRKQVESAYLRAICRTIGLNALTQIIQTPGSHIRQDVVGWLCTSLRGTENKLYHFTDNLQGCGFYLEGAVNTAFKNVIQAIVKSMATSNNSEEIKCMLEGLKWKYHGDDHSFLAEIDLFSILRGQQVDNLLRKVWGQGNEGQLKEIFTFYKSVDDFDKHLVQKLLELFEIIVILCVGKVGNVDIEDMKMVSVKPKDKPLMLEKQISAIDEYSAEILIQQAFNVLFNELQDALENYMNHEGLDWGAYQRAKIRKELIEQEKKKKKKGSTTEARRRSYSDSEGQEEEEEPQQQKESTDKKLEDDDLQYLEQFREFYEEMIELEEDQEQQYQQSQEQQLEQQQLLEEEKKVEEVEEEEKKKDEKQVGDRTTQRLQKLKEIIENEERLLNEKLNQLYNPEFLYRLLGLMHKCISYQIDQVALAIGNPHYIGTLLGLLKYSPPIHRMLIVKILMILFKMFPQAQLFVDSYKDYMKRIEPQQWKEMSNKKISQIELLKHLLGNMKEIRIKTFENNKEFNEEYMVSEELVDLIRVAMELPGWGEDCVKVLEEMLNGNELNQIIAMSILGGEINGLRMGKKIRINSTNNDELFEDNILLKETFEEGEEVGVILGFSNDYKEKLSEEEQKKQTEKKLQIDPRFNVFNSLKEGLNVVSLVNSQLAKVITNLNSIEFTISPRFKTIGIDNIEFKGQKQLKQWSHGTELTNKMNQVYELALIDDSENQMVESRKLYLRTIAMKSLYNWVMKGDKELITQQLRKGLMKQALNKVNLTSGNGVGLELSEERLFRLLKTGAETSLMLDDLNSLSATIKNNELEVVFGKDFSNMKYMVYSGYNMEKIGKELYEVMSWEDEIQLLKTSEEQIKSVKGKAILVTNVEFEKIECAEILKKAKIVITYDWDIQKLKEEFDGGNVGGQEKGLMSQQKKKKLNKKEKKELLEKRKKIKEKLPECIVNIGENCFMDLVEELKKQKIKQFKNIFEEKSLVEELVEFGFERSICQEYYDENPKATLDQMVTEILKLIEQKEEEEQKAKMRQQFQDEKFDQEDKIIDGQQEDIPLALQQQKKQKKEKKGGPQQPLQKEEEKKDKQDKKPIKTKEDKKEKEEEKKEDKKKVKEEDDEMMMKKKKLMLLEKQQGKPIPTEELQLLEGTQKKPKQPQQEKKLQDKKEEKEKVIVEKIQVDKKAEDSDSELDEKDLIEDDNQQFEIEKEDPNACFKCKGEKEMQQLIEEKNRTYDSCIEFEGLNNIGKIILFKQTNRNLAILYARRVILRLLELEKEENEIFLLDNQELAIKYLKLVYFEAIFNSSQFCNNELLLRVSRIVTHLLERAETNEKIKQFIELLFKTCIIDPLEELEKKYLNNNDNKKNEFFSGLISSESNLEQPYLEFSLHLASLFMKSSNNEMMKKIVKFQILYTLVGLATKIKGNKSLGWGLLIFCLNYTQFLRQWYRNNSLNENEDIPMIFSNQNIKLLHNFVSALKMKEKSGNYSRKTQLSIELLIFLNKFQQELIRIGQENKLTNYQQDALSVLDLHKFQLIQELTQISEIMEFYKDNLTLTASSWLQLNKILIEGESKIIEGDHFYYKSLHTLKFEMAQANELQLKFSDDSHTDMSDSLLLSSDSNGQHSLQKFSGSLSKQSALFPSGMFYLHFPTQGSNIYGFGQNEYSQLTSADSSQQGPYVLHQFSTTNVQQISCGDLHTLFLNKNGELYGVGNGTQTGVSSGTIRVAQKVQVKDNKQVIKCAAGQNFSIFVCESNEIYAMGSNTDGRCGLNYNSGSATPMLVEFPKTKIVKQISCGNNHSMILTTEGNLYATGNNEHGQLGLVDENGNKMSTQQQFKQVNDLSKKNVLKVCAGQYFTVVSIKDKIGQGYMVMSCGEKSQGKLGLGSDSSTSVAQFTEIKNLNGIEIVLLEAKKKHVIAKSKQGQVYGWGANDYGQLGLGNTENQFEPKILEFFNNNKLLSVAVGMNHTIFIVKTKDSDEKQVYVCGETTNNKLCLKQQKEKLLVPTKVDFFTGKQVMKVISGGNHSFIITENMKISNFRDIHKQFECIECFSGEPIEGPLIIRPDVLQETLCYQCYKKIEKQGEIIMYAKECINKEKQFKWPNIYENLSKENLFKKFTDENIKAFDGTHCCQCKISPITNILYFPVHDTFKNAQDFMVCEKCIKEIQTEQVSPTIYYRINQPLNDNIELPIYPRNYFYNHSDTYGYSITVTPKFSEKGFKYMIEKYKESYEEFSNDFSKITLETDEQLVDLLNTIAQKKEKTVSELDDLITFPKEELNLRQALENCSQDLLRKRFMILKQFNQKIQSIIPYIDFTARSDLQRLRNIYANSSVFIFWDIKSDLFEKVLALDAKQSSNDRFKVNRMKASKFVAKGKPDLTGEYTVFGQIFQYYKATGYGNFKLQKDGSPFTVQFVGEASIDVGGPYREAISHLCTELQSAALDLFIPSPNQKNDSGQFREKWVLNPSATTLIQLKMLEFIGALMGCAIRTKNFLNLDLPSIIWKQLVDSPVTRKDLENIDRYTIQCLDDLINIHKKGVNEEQFNELIQEKFVTALSNGAEVELCKNGKNMPVTYDKREEYAILVEQIRLKESIKQIQALKNGLTQVIPEGLLNLLTWRELETQVCGRPVLDIDLLQENSVYRGCSESDPVIEFFWKALREFSTEERSMYLRFVWGRSRLPLTSKEFPMKHQIELIRKAGSEPDMMLPVAHTCFFSIELPKYSTYEILRDKLKYAITHCQAIDTDGRAYDIWEDED